MALFSFFFVFFWQVCVGALLLTLHWEILSTEISVRTELLPGALLPRKP
jgi:hypothetical protein